MIRAICQQLSNAIHILSISFNYTVIKQFKNIFNKIYLTQYIVSSETGVYELIIQKLVFLNVFSIFKMRLQKKKHNRM